MAVLQSAPSAETLVDQLRDWVGLLDRHSSFEVHVLSDRTRIEWTTLAPESAEPAECLFRRGALTSLFNMRSNQLSFDVQHTECLGKGGDCCAFEIVGLQSIPDVTHATLFREAYLLAGNMQGRELITRRMAAFSARSGPFPDVRGIQAVRRFMEEVEDLILIFDHDLMVLDANRAAVQLYGFTLHEFRGLSARDLMSEESFRIVQKTLPLLLERGSLRGLRIEGRTRTGWATLEVSARAAGNRESLVCIARDIGKRLHLEQELETRNRLLREQNKRIAQAGRLKSEFLANVSHELTTPLTSIRGFTKMLRSDMGSELNGEDSQLSLEKRLEFLRIVQDESLRMGDLIEGLLELSKIESGTVTLDRARVSLNRIVQESIMVLKPRLDEHDLQVDVNLDPNIPQALLDPDRMKQVVLNLLDNAIKFTESDQRIELRTVFSNEMALLTVRNPAGDLEPADLGRIFGRFVQGDGSFRRKKGGVGLGLNLVRAIVEMHGGNVWAEMRDAEHVEFVVELPLMPS